MALVLQDRVRVNSTGSGTGSISLGSAYPGYRSFASCVPDGSVVYYCIHNTSVGHDDEWEVGYGTYTLGTNSLSRTNVYSSSNSGSLVNFTSGANGLEVFITYPSEQAVYQETNGDVKLIQGAMTVSEDGTVGTTLPNTAYQAFTTGNYYMQSNMQNLDSGTQASSDWVATADNGTDTEFYVDLGIASSGYNFADYSAQRPNSGYLMSTGSDLRLIAGKYGANISAANASATDIVFIAGDLLNDGQRGRIKGLTGNWILSNSTSPTDNGQKLQVVGNAAISSDLTTNLVYSSGNVSLAANSTVLATKAYVDVTSTTGIQVHTPAYAETIGNVNAIYNNGSSGVGATLTNNGANAVFTTDGISIPQYSRILVADQTDQTQNGIYELTTVGAADSPGPGAKWVLTRTTDADTYGTGSNTKLAQGSYIYVQYGNTAAGESYLCTTSGTITFGSTSIVFTQFSATPAYTGTAPINVSGQTISLSGVVDTAHGGTNLSSYTTGDIIYSSATNVLGKRGIGSTDQVLLVNGGVPTWGGVALGSANAVSGTLTADHGGTGQSTYTTGDLIYASATNTLSKLAGQTTTTKKYLSQTGDGVNSAAPAWAQVAAADISGLAPSATTDTSNATNITSGTLPSGRITGSYTGLTGTGTLTTGTWNANVITTTYGGTGVAGTLSGLVYGNGATAMSAATADQVVAVIGSTAVANATYSVSSNSSTYTSNIIGGAAGSIPYQTGANTTSLLATGSGVLVGGTTPAWSTAPTLTGTNFSSIPNSATTATAANTASAIVARDASGNFTAGTITATLSGAATTAVTVTGAAQANITSVGTLTGLSVSSGGSTTAANVTSSGSTTGLLVTDTGINGANIKLAGNGATTPNKTIRAINGNLGIVNSAYTSEIFTLTDAGALSVAGAVTAAGVTLTGNTLTAGTGISVSASTGASTITNTGVTSAVAGTGISVSGATGAVTFSIPQAVATTSSVQFGSFGVGTAASGVTGEIRATNNVTAYYSDDRMKTNLGNIPDALAKLKTLNGFYYEANELAQSMGYEAKKEVGVSAQQVQAIMPEVVAPAPIDENYLTVRYERLVPLLIEAIKELEAQVAELKAR